MSARHRSVGSSRSVLLAFIVAALALAACTSTPSDASDINRPGTWQVSFMRLIDLDGPPYVEQAPAPEYPTRTMTTPIPDTASCSPGCTCTAIATMEVCEGDGSTTCRAWGGFTETCPAAHTLLDCSIIEFEANDHTTGVCVLEDLSRMDAFGYVQLQRYEITLDRLSYN